MKNLVVTLSVLLIGSVSMADSLHPATGSKCYDKAVDMVHASSVVEKFLRGSANSYFSYSEDTTTVGEGEVVVQENHMFSVNEISVYTVSFIQEGCRLTKTELEVGE